MEILKQWRERRRQRKIAKETIHLYRKRIKDSVKKMKKLEKVIKELGKSFDIIKKEMDIFECTNRFECKDYKGMGTTKFTKLQKATLAMFVLVVLLDMFCLIHCIVIGDTFGIFLYLLWIVNIISICWVYYDYIQIKKQHNELQKYHDDFYKYYDYKYAIDNTHGHYGIEEFGDIYFVHKSCDDGINFIVKVFKFDTADENSKAEAKAKAEELLNLITEGGTLWRE